MKMVLPLHPEFFGRSTHVTPEAIFKETLREVIVLPTLMSGPTSTSLTQDRGQEGSMDWQGDVGLTYYYPGQTCDHYPIIGGVTCSPNQEGTRTLEGTIEEYRVTQDWGCKKGFRLS